MRFLKSITFFLLLNFPFCHLNSQSQLISEFTHYLGYNLKDMNEAILKNFDVEFISKSPNEERNTLFYTTQNYGLPDDKNGFMIFVTFDLEYSKVLLFAISSGTSNLYNKIKQQLISNDYLYKEKGNKEIFESNNHSFVLSTEVMDDRIKYIVSVVNN